MPQIGMIFLENESFAAVTASAAPKMHALSGQYLNLSNYNSTSHPSLPDYCAPTSGSWLGKAGSDSGAIGFAGNHANIFTALGAAGFRWKAYEEGVSLGSNYTAWTGSGTGKYASRHCPGTFYSGVDAKPGNGAASGRFDFRGGPTGSLLDDMASKSLPDFFFISPDLNNDGHDSSVTYADNWLAGKNPEANSPTFPGIDALIGSLRPNGCVLITFDNPGGSSGTHIYGCVVGPNVPAQTISTFHSHLTALFGVQQEFGIAKFTGTDEIPAYANLTSSQALPWPTGSNPPPGLSISSVSPNSGVVGATTTITGSGFTGASSVTFGSTSATFTVLSNTQIAATVPTLSAAVYTVNVTVSATTASLVNGFTVTSAAGITGFSPTSGPIGTLVTVTGTAGSFVGVTSVAFHGTSAVFSVLSQTQLQATVPSGATTGTITIATSGGNLTSLSSFTVSGGGGGGGTPVTSLNILIVPCQRTGTPLPGSLPTWQTNMARVQALWQTASYGQLALSYTFSETANLDPALAVNDTNALRGAALSWLSANSGIRWWTFDAIVYFGPDSLQLERGSGEGFVPAGVFGPYPQGSITAPVTAAHEIGHLLGLNHAGLDTVTPFLGTSTLTTLEGLVDNSTIYGDGYDPMGANLYLSQPNAHAKNRLGWLGPRARLITTTGTYNLDALELPAAVNPQALVVSGQSGIQYWVEYRIPGATEDVDSAANAAQPALFSPRGITLRIRAGNTVNSDQDPASQRSFLLSAASPSQNQLAVGQTFTDPGGSLQIHTVSAGSSTASVQVTNPVAATLVPQENLMRPGGVANLTVNTAASDSTHAALIWTHPVGATGVTTVYRDGIQIAVLTAGVANYTDTVTAGSTHAYVVATNTSAGVGGPTSNLVTYTASSGGGGGATSIATAPDAGTPGFFDLSFTAGSHKGRVDDITVANNVVYVAHSAPDVTDSGSTLATVPNLTAFRRDTKTVKTAWHPSPNGRVYRLQPLGSSLVATGAFSTIGGQARGGIARFTPLSGVSDTSGFALAATPGNLAADGAVTDVVFNAARTVAWVAGDFSNIGGSARRGVARFTIASDGSWALDTGFNANIAAFVAGGGGRCVALKPDESKLVYGQHPGNNGTDVHTVPSLLGLNPTTGAGATWANKIFYTLVANEHPGAFEMRGDAGGVYVAGLWNGGNSLCYFDWNGSGPNSVTIQANCNPTTASTSSVTAANCIWYFGCDGNVQAVGLVSYGGNQFIAAGHHGDVVALTKNHESGTAGAPGPVGNTTSHGLFLVTAGAGGGTLDSYGNPPSFGAGTDSDPLKLWAIYQDPASGDLHVGGDFTNVNSETNDLHRRYAVFSASGGGSSSDLTPPSAPSNLDATAQSTSAIGLNWANSTDNIGVTGYRIYRDGRLVGTVPGP